jgi:hypothetical protein
MEKTKEQLLADYKKSNKQRREKIVKAAGFETEGNYLASLENKPLKPSKKAPKPVNPAKIKVSEEKDKLDYVVAFDTTGSMGSYINAVKGHVETLIPSMFSQDIDLKMKVVAFGDYCDINRWGSNPTDGFGVAYQQSSFTDNQSELINFVKGAKTTGGGDEDEFYELVIKKIVEETPWREGARKAVLFIADCNPHPVGYYYNGKSYQIDWKVEAKKAAEKGIAFDTLSIHGEKYPWYKELAKITGGVYLPFQSSSKMSEVVTASAYARGSKMSKATFTASYSTAKASGDTELVGVYKSLSTLLD